MILDATLIKCLQHVYKNEYTALINIFDIYTRRLAQQYTER